MPAVLTGTSLLYDISAFLVDEVKLGNIAVDQSSKIARTVLAIIPEDQSSVSKELLQTINTHSPKLIPVTLVYLDALKKK